jgi:DNA-binding transcriptional MerR regulator
VDEGPSLCPLQVRMMKQISQNKSKAPSLVRNAPPSTAPAIPDKLYFRIGDVAKLCGVEAYVLRFWESEFPQLKPNKSGTGQRLYRRRDVELALRIKHLLYADGYTIAGARQVFTAESRESKKTTQSELPLKRVAPVAADGRASGAEKQLLRLRGELREILGMLSVPVELQKQEISAKKEHHGKPGRVEARGEDPRPRRDTAGGPGLFDA